ncbi:SpoIIE family protein phosphatase [Kitasatospora sp. NBC_01539]|uniref:SpoIIE family protein phosphatase n=1 Tax=Kitasatospora sp. NBC_01539 TaxID=2903577 RepID=UPI0038602FAD
MTTPPAPHGRAVGRPPVAAVPQQHTRPADDTAAAAGTTVDASGADASGADGAARPPAGGGVVGRLASTVERLRAEVADAHAAADGRALVELATGILVERLGCGPALAGRQLADLARKAGVPPLELAADLIDQASRDRFTEVAREFVATATATDSATAATSATAASTAAAAAAPTAAPPGSLSVRLRTAGTSLRTGDVQAVADSLMAHALAPLGATGVAVWAAQADGSLALAGSAGFSPEEARRWHHVPPGVHTPATRALADRGPAVHGTLALPSIGQYRFPGGRVAVPAGVNGRISGVLELCWPEAIEPPAPRILRQIEALAELCAHAMEDRPAAADRRYGPGADAQLWELRELTDGLQDAALILRPVLGGDGRPSDFTVEHVNPNFLDFAGRPRSAVAGATLLEAYPMAAEPGGLFEKVESVHATGEPFREARMQLVALVDDVPLRSTAAVAISRHADRVVVVWRLEDDARRVASLLQHAQRLGRIGGFEEDLRTGEITWNDTLFDLYGLPATAAPVALEQLAASAHTDDAHAIGRFLRAVLHHRQPASTAFRLQRADGVDRHIRVVAEPVLDAVGRLVAVRGAYQDVSAQHWTEVALAATRDRLADTEARSAERDRLALQLQHAIMPPNRGPLRLGGLNVAVRYRPAEEEHAVGGDWYDTVTLPTGQVMLCVGDVAGHGIDAATGMVALRNALRGLAATGAGPAQLLSWLNVVAFHLTESATATAVCALFDPQTRSMRWARAGHLPPVLLRRDGADTLPRLGGILLGAIGDAEYEEGRVQLEPGDTLLMYTDGLVERKDRSLEESLGQLLETALRPRQTEDRSLLESRLDHLLTYSSADTDDDTCIIGIEVG